MTNETGVSPFQLLLAALSLLVLTAMAAELALPLRPDTVEVLEHVDSTICFLFLIDFFTRLAKAPRKGRFLRWGWTTS